VRGVLGQLDQADSGSAGERDLTVIDMEASIEHLSRGTLRHVDTLLIVAEPYFRALETAGRTVKLARDLAIPNVFAVANKVRTPEDAQAVRDYCAGHDLEVVAVVPFDESVTTADRNGNALLDVAPDSPAVAAITSLADRVAGRQAVSGQAVSA